MLKKCQILESCPHSWITHVVYGLEFLVSHESLKMKSPQLYQFAMTWFLTHVVLASTASRSMFLLQNCSNLLGCADGVSIHPLTGCSKTLLRLLVDIADLAESMLSKSRKSLGFTSDQGSFNQRRRDLEARLCEHPFGTDAESERERWEEPHLPEVKRLATLIYFYARVDESGPHERHMRYSTAKILSLLPIISLRTNILLWPLFIVGAFGVRPESDEDRKLVLGTLDNLQKTKQLGCVRKARSLMEETWKARGLDPRSATRGWSVLRGRHRNVSLA